MNNFEEINALVDRLEAGTITREEAIQQAAAARYLLARMYHKFESIQRQLETDPAALERMRQTLADNLFSKVIEKE